MAPAWGITGAPARDGPYGRPGPWAQEVGEIEAAYGPGRTLHLSLEEFARTLRSVQETVERFREGGVRHRELTGRLAAASAAGEVATFARAYRTFRSFDRPNVLHLYTTFRFDRSFAREVPEAVQAGPLWPGRFRRTPRRVRTGPWVWYASPVSAQELAVRVVAGLASVPDSPHLFVRTPRPWNAVRSSRSVTVRTAPIPPGGWERRFRTASLRIVTGSRTLLEALEVGGPFLYFNGAAGRGAARRRHRPEKIVSFLRLARSTGWPPDLVRDLADFARGRRVPAVVARAAGDAGGWGRFPPCPRPQGFARGFAETGPMIVRLARRFATGVVSAPDLVADYRRRSRP